MPTYTNTQTTVPNRQCPIAHLLAKQSAGGWWRSVWRCLHNRTQQSSFTDMNGNAIEFTYVHCARVINTAVTTHTNTYTNTQHIINCTRTSAYCAVMCVYVCACAYGFAYMRPHMRTHIPTRTSLSGALASGDGGGGIPACVIAMQFYAPVKLYNFHSRRNRRMGETAAAARTAYMSPDMCYTDTCAAGDTCVLDCQGDIFVLAGGPRCTDMMGFRSSGHVQFARICWGTIDTATISVEVDQFDSIKLNLLITNISVVHCDPLKCKHIWWFMYYCPYLPSFCQQRQKLHILPLIHAYCVGCWPYWWKILNPVCGGEHMRIAFQLAVMLTDQHTSGINCVSLCKAGHSCHGYVFHQFVCRNEISANISTGKSDN